eukprot:9469412-Pyramimonas_sp.AAC.1
MGEVSSPEIPDGVHPRSAPGGIPMMRDLESLTPKELKNVRGKVIKTLAKLNEHRAQRRSLMEEFSSSDRRQQPSLANVQHSKPDTPPRAPL